MNPFAQHTKTSFSHNPFAGLLDQEIDHALVVKAEVGELVEALNHAQQKIIAFVGKQGRGKTTHLKWLHQQLPQYPYFDLGEPYEFSQILNHQQNLLFLDSIHHISFRQRIQLYRSRKSLVFTTHWRRTWEGILASRNIQHIAFKGINQEVLKAIITKRFELTLADSEQVIPVISDNQITHLIDRFGDDYRGIINYLYDKFQA